MIFNQIIGTSDSDNLVATSSSDIILASGGHDQIDTNFDSTDYIIGGDGEDTLIINGNYSDFTITEHFGIDQGYLVNNGEYANVVKGVELFVFNDKSVSLDEFLNPGTAEISVDNRGLLSDPETFDAAGDDYLFTDDLNEPNNLIISNFAQGDQIQFSNIAQEDYLCFTNDGADVIITYNNTTQEEPVISSLTLLGVVSAEDIIYDQGSFEAAIGFDAVV